MTSAFESFFERVLCDEKLQEQLHDIDKVDEFVARVVELGAENNFIFSAAIVEEAMQASRRTWLERSI